MQASGGPHAHPYGHAPRHGGHHGFSKPDSDVVSAPSTAFKFSTLWHLTLWELTSPRIYDQDSQATDKNESCSVYPTLSSIKLSGQRYAGVIFCDNKKSDSDADEISTNPVKLL